MRFSSSPRGTVILAYRRCRDSEDDARNTTMKQRTTRPEVLGSVTPVLRFHTFRTLQPTTINSENKRGKKNIKLKGDAWRQK